MGQLGFCLMPQDQGSVAKTFISTCPCDALGGGRVVRGYCRPAPVHHSLSLFVCVVCRLEAVADCGCCRGAAHLVCGECGGLFRCGVFG